ncbi:YjbF family lipoprotein [Rhodobacter sp. TJ_12]|uniref:YjbF family lipoprotein n=1 Tax=Rhodobacter sp. TJ_12 TaxID=2029399 RepID=UPI001CBDF7E2|nr:YjbF family lipoprotein [Rhodobacter sp. TJ_12]
MTRLSVFCLVGAAAVLLAGCSSDPQTQRLINGAVPFVGQPEVTANANFLAAYEADAPGVAVVRDDTPDALAVALRQTRSAQSGVETMIAADGTQFMLRKGILVGTRGLGNDLMAAEVTPVERLVSARGSGVATRLMTFIDGNDHAVTRAFKCDIYPGGLEDVTVGTTPIQTRLMTEYCRGPFGEFYNYYWVVPGSGEIVQSNQWAGPLTGKISLRKVPSVRS